MKKQTSKQIQSKFKLATGKYLVCAALAAAPLLMFGTVAQAQIIETSRDRVVTNLAVDLPIIGTVKSRSTDEIKSSNWLIGCETLDRDFADYEQYKTFIAPLGIKRLRMQAGWNKTEKVKGVYDFTWLDKIVDDAVSRGLQPWLQTSYGNELYPGGGGANLGAGMPTSKEALDAYNKWVAALVTRYKDKVVDWEVWNEPNFGDNTDNTPELTADFNIRTAEIIKKIQPTAKISGLALGHFNQEYVERFFDHIGKKRKFDLFDNMTYHDYVYNPDSNYLNVAIMRAALEKHTKTVKLRQGENGAPSAGGIGRGALWDHDWNELSQAKWNTRRMLGNLGNDIESSIFGLVEMAYTFGPINRLNYKGILKSDYTKRVIRPKIAYYSMQNVTSIFDDSLERMKKVHHTYNPQAAGPDEHRVSYTTDRSVAVYGYQHKQTKKQVYTFWLTENIPSNTNEVRPQEFVITNANFDTPVVVDIVSGVVYGIPEDKIIKKGNITTLKDIPLYDAPIVIADKSLVRISDEK
jgi:Glycosyl hydrolases family 39